ncbi:fungal-specific transcription factor domain-containing protein [Mycena belliarum]|uniref:Fungal-specific transcription factor domain-containing protein n=1 Tax=Mycena belliarum TaxID=1033014 RepID=A0AAD6XP60_9AGAR|nr:fungal-specific transcription factor domain-containing protein [Mycena belliae]
MHDESTEQSGKRRRLQGACDVCKRKKIRCDSSEKPGNRCTHCINAQIECTHARLKGAENLWAPATAQELVQTILTTSSLPTNPFQVLLQIAKYARSLEEKLAALMSAPVSRYSTSSIDEGSSSPENRPPSPVTAPADPELFRGKSSSLHFIKSAIKHMHGDTPIVVGVQRPEFWAAQPWEKLIIETPQQHFPEDDLLASLVAIYCEQMNPILCILHSPSFRQSVAQGRHFRDPDFGAVVLAVCALASRSSDDPRVFLEDVHSEHSCGWKWFRQVRPFRVSFSPEPSLHQLQVMCLSVMYLAGTSNSEEGWLLAGIGLRLAQGAGAHHRSGYNRLDTLEAELLKRVFYVLFCIDMIMNLFKGRPPITQSFDFDLDPPVDCDEEYWENPNAVQPPGKPSTGSFLVAYLPLMMIFGRIHRAVYPVNGEIASSQIIAELDSELNRWVDALPDHLRWDPNQENQILLNQSAALYTIYYHAQIVMHRPFIPAPGKDSMTSTRFPSLAICANAARSCGHVLDEQTRRGRGLLLHPQVITVLFDCAVVLLINVWAVVGKAQTTERYHRATADVENCVRVLRLYERRWRVAGRKCDIIDAMLNIGKYTSGPTLKRSRGPEEDAPSPPDVLVIPPASPTAPTERRIAGHTRAMSVAQQMQALELSIQETEHLFSLPLRSEELGRLPVYDSYDYEPALQPDHVPYEPRIHVEPHWGGTFAFPTAGALHGGDSVYYEGPNFSPPLPAPDATDMPLENSFNIPSGDRWRDWSTYFANVDGLSQEGF